MSGGVIVLNTKGLVLNRHYLPVHVTSVRRAFSLLYQGLAEAVDEQYRTFDFDSWSALSATVHDDTIGMVNRIIRVPRVILLLTYDRIPRRQVRFNRFNVYSRDRNTCQSCGHRALPCTRHRGARTPKEAGMKLLPPPRRPEWTPFMLETFSLRRYREWLPFLSTVDAAYWNTEPQPEYAFRA